MKAFMDKYTILIKIYLKIYWKYPMDLFLKLIYLPVQMLMYVFLWKALLQYQDENLSYYICYYLFVILLGYAFPFAHIATDMQYDIEEGGFSNYLVRPVHYSIPIITRFTSWMICYSVIFIPAIVFVFFFRQISIGNLLYFFCYLLFGIVIEFLTWYNIGLLSLKLEKLRGIIITFQAFKSLTSGTLIPLSMFPEKIRLITKLLPMKFYIYTPINSLLNGETASNFLGNIILAAGWIFFLILLSNAQWYFGLKKFQMNIN